MSSAAEKTFVRVRTPPATVRVPQWPLRDEPWKSGVVFGILLLASAVSGLAVKRSAMAVAVLLLLSLTVSRMWWPCVYEFSPKGVLWSHFGRKRRIAWSDIGRVEFQQDGVLLCADRHPQPFST